MQIIVKGENIFNLPNAISFYRLLMFPVILVLLWGKNEFWFVILLCINLVSDILDGNIARIFNLKTKFGAALDNLADMGTYLLALLGIFMFRWDQIQPHVWILYLFLIVFTASYLVAFFRFKKIPGLHLYSAVSAGYLQGIFFFILFAVGFYSWLYYLAVGWRIVAYLEKILVLLRIETIRSGIKGLYWLNSSEQQTINNG
ncbi:MAG: CDP-alcohol phosphatidyltransferase family protein [Mariniphaga sp.]|nr:CDP-alcohol phosphatidyltransferase family protein [Mariniphaga sp.]